MMTNQQNDADRPRGLYCQHGHRLMIPDPAAPGYDSAPGLVFVCDRPCCWPCPEPDCSREAIEALFERKQDEYAESLWREWQATQG